MVLRGCKVLILLSCISLLAGCYQKFNGYEDPSQAYNRQKICHELTGILQPYYNLNNPKVEPIPRLQRSKVAKYYKDYKIYGCEK